MPVEKSVNAYKNTRLNCAQSVFIGFQKKHGVSDEVIVDAKAFGGGRADEGMCGALFAAVSMIKDGAIKEQIVADFVKKAGSEKCREIRKIDKLKCDQCVELAANLMVEHG